jgi:hypothetical protein
VGLLVKVVANHRPDMVEEGLPVEVVMVNPARAVAPVVAKVAVKAAPAEAQVARVVPVVVESQARAAENPAQVVRVAPAEVPEVLVVENLAQVAAKAAPAVVKVAQVVKVVENPALVAVENPLPVENLLPAMSSLSQAPVVTSSRPCQGPEGQSSRPNQAPAPVPADLYRLLSLLNHQAKSRDNNSNKHKQEAAYSSRYSSFLLQKGW